MKNTVKAMVLLKNWCWLGNQKFCAKWQCNELSYYKLVALDCRMQFIQATISGFMSVWLLCVYLCNTRIWFHSNLNTELTLSHHWAKARQILSKRRANILQTLRKYCAKAEHTLIKLWANLLQMLSKW